MLKKKKLLLTEFVLMHMTTVDWCKILETQYYFVTLPKSHLHKSTFLIFGWFCLWLATPPLLILNTLRVFYFHKVSFWEHPSNSSGASLDQSSLPISMEWVFPN